MLRSKLPYFPGVRPALKKSYALKIVERRKQKNLNYAIQVDERWNITLQTADSVDCSTEQFIAPKDKRSRDSNSQLLETLLASNSLN